MTTLAALKARIVDDLNRSDLTTQIADAINDAIDFYEEQRFYFNETRASTFATVSAQSTYTSSDDADIPLWVALDAVYITDSNSETYELDPIDPVIIEAYLDNSASSGRPRVYSYYEQSFRFHPIPNAVFTVRPLGVIKKAAPATDSEASNVWMVDAFELIRCRAKAYLGLHVLRNPDLVVQMVGIDGNGGAAAQAHAKLRRETKKKTDYLPIEATTF